MGHPEAGGNKSAVSWRPWHRIEINQKSKLDFWFISIQCPWYGSFLYPVTSSRSLQTWIKFFFLAAKSKNKNFLAAKLNTRFPARRNFATQPTTSLKFDLTQSAQNFTWNEKMFFFKQFLLRYFQAAGAPGHF